MTLNFPSNPTNGQKYPDPAEDGVYQWTYDASKGIWTGGRVETNGLNEVLNIGNASDKLMILGTNNSTLPTNIQDGINSTPGQLGLFVEGENLVVASDRNNAGNSENGVLIGSSGAIELFRASNTGFIDFKTSAEFRANDPGLKDNFDWRFQHQNDLFKVFYSDPNTSEQTEIVSLSPTGMNQINGGNTPVKAFISGGNFAVGQTDNGGGVLLDPSGAIEIWDTDNLPRIDFKTTGDFSTNIDDYDWRMYASPDLSFYFMYGINGQTVNTPLALLGGSPGGVIINGNLNGSPVRIGRGTDVQDSDIDNALDSIKISVVDSKLNIETTNVGENNEFIFDTTARDGSTQRAVNYDAVITLLLATVKKQQAQIEALQSGN